MYDTLRYREKYLHAFRRFSARVKHDVEIPVYQLIAESHTGLNVETPKAFVVTDVPEIGTPADLVFERAEGSTGRYLMRLIDYIQQTSKDDAILIMTQHRLSKPIDGMPQTQELREEYCKLLLRKAREENVSYRRIICFDDTNDVGFKPDFVMPWLIEHFREMLQLKKVYPDKISIKVSRRKIGADIIVIPRKLGAVVLDVYDLQTGTTSTNSTFFFHNPPNQRIIEQLHAWFMEIDGQAGTISVSDIP